MFNLCSVSEGDDSNKQKKKPLETVSKNLRKLFFILQLQKTIFVNSSKRVSYKTEELVHSWNRIQIFSSNDI